MKRAAAIAAFGFSLAGCSGMPEMPSLSLSGFGSPSATTVQFESEPSGAEARTSTGQTCRTPCAQAVSSSEFTVTFTLNGYQTQSVPVRIAASNEQIDPNTGAAPSPRLVPNPVFAELQPVAAPPPARRRTTPPKPRPQPVAQQQQQRSAAPPPPPAAQAPAPAPAAAWPPPPSR